jgi:hypothetical protein
MNLFEARKLARECMYDDQLAAVEALVRAILANPDDPGLPTVEPPAEGQDPQTGVHAQGTTEPAEPMGGEVIAFTPYAEAEPVPAITDYERGWRAGRGAAVRAVEDLVSQSVRQSPEEAAWVTALNVVNALDVKAE